MTDFFSNIFQTVVQSVSGASPPQLIAVVALAAISLAAFAIYAVMAIARDRK